MTYSILMTVMDKTKFQEMDVGELIEIGEDYAELVLWLHSHNQEIGTAEAHRGLSRYGVPEARTMRTQEVMIWECSTCGRLDFAPFYIHFSLGQRCVGVVAGFAFVRKSIADRGQFPPVKE